MLPVNWGVLDGELIERVVSVMILREFPDGNRRRATQGDGGIDVVVPIPDNSSRCDVYQIKKYNQPLKSDQKAKIGKSAEKLLQHAKMNNLAVREWNLVLPLDQAAGEQEWIDGLFEGTDVIARWKGLAHVDGLASRYQDVVDYYLFAGQERVHDLVRSAMDLAKLQTGPEAGLDLDSLYQSTRSIYDRLNTADPHFSYDIAMMHATPSEFAAPDGVVMSQFIGKENGPTLRVDVFAKHGHALDERPITSQMRFSVPNESDLRAAIEQFDVFGEDLYISEEFAEVAIDDPLSGTVEMQPMAIRLTSPDANRDRRLRLLVTDADGERLATSFFTVYKVNQGPTGKGLRARMRSEGGLIELTQDAILGVSDTYSGTFKFHIEWADKVAKRILPDVLFGKELHGDRRLVMAEEFSGPFTEFASLVEIPDSPIPAWLVKYVEALSELQEFAIAPLFTRRPSDESDEDEIRQVLLIASILHGNSISRTAPQMGVSLEGVEYEPVVEQVNATGRYAMRTAFNVTVVGEEISIPGAYFWADNVRARLEVNGEVRMVVLSPAVDGGVVRMHTALEAFVSQE